jgi:tripartite-type tricarboxylate transporter receptor subunit TctC
MNLLCDINPPFFPDRCPPFRTAIVILISVFATLFFAISSLSALAQAYPNRPIRMIMPFAPGGGVDTVMRVVVQGMSQSSEQTYILDNRPSDGGNVALEMAANAQPDGYTIIVSTPIITVNPILYPRVRFKVTDFTAISLLGKAPAFIVINPSVPARTISELIKMAKAKPGALRYGAPTGSGPYLAMEMFRAVAGIDITHIPYKSSPAAVVDTLNGQIDMVSLTAPTTMAYVRANRLRALAQTGTTRLPIASDIPTLEEAGVPNASVYTWYMTLAPAKTPLQAIKYLNSEFVKSLAIQDVRKRMAGAGVDEIVGSSASEASVFLREEATRWAKVLKPIRD